MTALSDFQPIAKPTATPQASQRLRVRRALGDLVRKVFPRPLTKGEREELEAERKAKQHMKAKQAELLKEARKYARDIVERLIDLNVCYRYKKSENDFLSGGLKAVSFRQPYVLSEEAIYLEVDLRPGRPPRGIGVEELSDEKVLRNLSIACEHPVYARYEPDKGFWYIVERETGKRGIPVHVKFDDMLAARPASADGLNLPVGIGENKKPINRSLGQMYSMGIFGTIGGGKSNALSVMLCTLLRYNSPKSLKLVLVDLKGGMEFSFFQGVPHLLKLRAGDLKPRKKPKKNKEIVVSDGRLQLGEEEERPDEPTNPEDNVLVPALIEKREQVPGALNWIIREGERRAQLIKEAHCKDIGKYNFKNRLHRLPHIVLVVDEWGDVKLDKGIGADCEEMLINVASRFRAVGIHVILCTQTPTKEVVTLRIKQVLPSRLVFSCPDIHASILCVGDASAYGLAPAGRGIFIWGNNRLEVQTPYINDAAVDSIVEQAIAGKFDEVEAKAHDVTDQEILEWVVSENGGELDYRKVFGQYRLRGLTQTEAKTICQSYEGKEVVVGSSTYKVMPGAGRRSRRLIALEEAPTESPENTP